jgi:hypothetical protein
MEFFGKPQDYRRWATIAKHEDFGTAILASTQPVMLIDARMQNGRVMLVDHDAVEAHLIGHLILSKAVVRSRRLGIEALLGRFAQGGYCPGVPGRIPTGLLGKIVYWFGASAPPSLCGRSSPGGELTMIFANAGFDM